MIVKGNYINGQWVSPSSTKRRPVINPATGQEIAAIYDSTKDDVRQAIEAAKKSFYITREWRDICPQERADMMFYFISLTRRGRIANFQHCLATQIDGKLNKITLIK